MTPSNEEVKALYKKWCKENNKSGGVLIGPSIWEWTNYLSTQYEAELADLRRWKAEAISVMPDYQEIGKELNLPLGSQCSPQILPGIQKLKAELSSLREKIVEVAGDSWDACAHAFLIFEDEYHEAKKVHLTALRSKINS